MQLYVFISSLILLLTSSQALTLNNAPGMQSGQEKWFPPPLDTHVHLFLDEGLMSWFYHGCFNCPLKATSWNDKFFSKANAETLENSGLRVVVASFYAHPLKFGTLRDSIRRQISLAENFVSTHHDEWVIAEDANQARAALKSGKRVMVFSLEGASGILEGEEDFREFIDQKKIRIVTLLHLTDDHLGGAAFLKGIQLFANPWAWFKSFFAPFSGEKVRTNSRSLTDEGVGVASELIKRKVWIDLTHSSDASQRKLIPMLLTANQPLLYTHTVLRRYYGVERGLADWQVSRISRSGGFVGILPSHEMLVGTRTSPADCQGDLQKLVRQYNDLADEIGQNAIAIGTDMNAPINHLADDCPKQESFWNLGQSANLWQAMHNAGARLPAAPAQVMDHFLELWSHVR